MLLSVHAIDGSDSAPTAGDWSIGPGLDLRQLGAGVDAQFGECIVDMVSHGMEGKVQLRSDAALLDYARLSPPRSSTRRIRRRHCSEHPPRRLELSA
jgi:hypothetical protein